MSHKQSYNTAQENKGTWMNNLVRFQQLCRRRRNVPTVDSSLEEYCKVPLQLQIIGRYQFLGAEIKGRNERVAKISEEVTNLCRNKLNSPQVSNQVIYTKLHEVLKTYD
ncbi:hypothetical protein L9F63_011207 [Diploptera punctata]|uniref:Uncharacterized protein n=1 Tax=Diploptera punctata TaxID=6984 RepID=A0AAD8AF43_DIPPU|nr:hypothetical protein L9F63_011207 [Diploptera punctata]